ncbi:hypothetical protein SBY92_000918 [Candida maltosa Xu316]|uniref:Uncharacterized protein n=1 Tax=Candida maltosa (strain Xu316) TaxID=1245528 RepID=M3JTR5_CANMX|nr:hypothetical protein G210_3508 [Candida maltosa Xu316]
MPDLFDNFFNKIGTKFTGGKTTHYNGGASQVNTGKFYNYTSSATNNAYWLPRQPHHLPPESETINVERKGSITSMTEEAENKDSRSRMNSIVE